MNNLQNTAKKLDIVFKILQILFAIGAVAMLVGVLIVGAAFAFDLAPEVVAEGYETLDLEVIELTLAEDMVPDKNQILLIEGISIAIVGICCMLAWMAMKSVRRIMDPLKQGQPFHATVSKELKFLALMFLILGAAVNIMEIVSLALTANTFDLSSLLLSDKITHITVNYDFDLSFLVSAGLMLLLSYIFRYGTELQEQVDETL